VQLDVLTIGDVGGVPSEACGDVGDGAHLVEAERAPVAADAQHEVLVVEFLGRQARGAAAIDTGAALGVQTPPAHPAPQILGGDGREALFGIDLFDPGADVQSVVLGLELLVGVQRVALTQCPLPGLFAAGGSLVHRFSR
jgi:hypothetical protein